MKSKKGAIELSMTTIIVIIIGITLLTLGLSWVKSSLNKVMDLTDQAFSMSDQEIEEMFANSDDLLKIVPNDVEIKKKNDEIKVAMILYNLDSDTRTIQAHIAPIQNGVPLDCKFGDTLSTTSKEYTLSSGANEKVAIVISKTPETTIGTGGCDITLTVNPDTIRSKSEQVLVKISG